MRGAEQVLAALKMLNQIVGQDIGPRGATFRDKERMGHSIEDSIYAAESGTKDVSNSDLAYYLKKADRDFFTADDAEVQRVAQVAADEIVRRLKVHMPEGVTRNTKNFEGLSVQQAQNIKGAAWTKAMKLYSEIVSGHMRDQKTIGGSPRRVDPDYAERRQEAFGVGTGIVGIASGDLLDNFASGEIKLKMGKADATFLERLVNTKI